MPGYGRRVQGRAGLGLLLGALGVLVAGASCSLGLDEALIDTPKDGGIVAVDGTLPDSAVIEAGVDTGIPTGPDATACASDDACTTTHGCLKGKCDLTRKACTYDVCRPSACNAAVCDVAARTCGATPTPYKYRPTQFNVGAQIACGKCAAAVHPWVFIVTSTGVVAFNTSNPTDSTPPQVPVVGLGFIPNQLVASGSRIWMVGAASGAGPSRVPLAYIDAPADPFVTKIQASTILASYTRPAEGIALFARGGDSALFVGPVAAQYPSTFIEAPLSEPISLTATAMPFAPNTGPSAMSGKRLLMSAVVNQAASFNFIDNAGSLAPASGPIIALTDAGAVSVHRSFAQSPDGAIFWATGVHQGAPGVPPGVTTRAARGYFLVKNDTSPIEGNIGIDIELYNVNAVPANAAIFGGNQATAAMLDANTAMIATQARENDQLTAVQFVKREPLGVVKDGMAPRRQVIPVPVNAFAAATASNGIGYLVANDVGGPTPSATVYMFDPACGL